MAATILLLTQTLKGALLAVGAGVWLFWALCGCYQAALAFAALIRRRPVPSKDGPLRRFCVVIPAHNEEVLLRGTLESVLAMDYPGDRYSVVVIADNCTDATADVARAGDAEALVRTDPDHRGKGFALAWGVKRLLADPRRFDAFVVFDADSEVCPGFLRAMDQAMDGGLAAVQGWYDVLNVQDNWRTRLMTCALALAHYAKPMGRAALGLTTGLKGNGMCFARSALERVPWSGESITEDIDYTLRLATAGIRVGFEPQAVVVAQMPVTGRQAATQRARWESGRYALVRQGWRCVAQGIMRRRLLLTDAGMDLVVPPFTELLAVPTLCVVGAAAWVFAAPSSTLANIALWAWLSVLAMLFVYLGVGLAAARVPLNVVSALVFAPLYAGWKLALYARMVLGGGPRGWQRTERSALAASGVPAGGEACERL